jgi:hypothetical protein
LLASAGHIPKELANVDFPVCPGCAYGKAHRRPWHYKGIKNRKRLRVASAPGEVVSIDQLVSPAKGFIPTHRGNPTTKPSTGATVFVDHYSDFTYTHLMTDQANAKTTIEAKLAFERVAVLRSTQKHSSPPLLSQNKPSLFAGHTHTIKTAKPRAKSKTSPLEDARCCHMQLTAGRRPSMLRYGQLPSSTTPICAISCRQSSPREPNMAGRNTLTGTTILRFLAPPGLW